MEDAEQRIGDAGSPVDRHHHLVASHNQSRSRHLAPDDVSGAPFREAAGGSRPRRAKATATWLSCLSAKVVRIDDLGARDREAHRRDRQQQSAFWRVFHRGAPGGSRAAPPSIRRCAPHSFARPFELRSPRHRCAPGCPSPRTRAAAVRHRHAGEASGLALLMTVEDAVVGHDLEVVGVSADAEIAWIQLERARGGGAVRYEQLPPRARSGSGERSPLQLGRSIPSPRSSSPSEDSSTSRLTTSQGARRGRPGAIVRGPVHPVGSTARSSCAWPRSL